MLFVAGTTHDDEDNEEIIVGAVTAFEGLSNREGAAWLFTMREGLLRNLSLLLHASHSLARARVAQNLSHPYPFWRSHTSVLVHSIITAVVPSPLSKIEKVQSHTSKRFCPLFSGDSTALDRYFGTLAHLPPRYFNMSNLISFQDGFINDDFAKLCEPFQPPFKFLWTGRKPRIGQRTETQVTVNGIWCRLSGIVTNVGDLPSFPEWVNNSMLPPQICLKCNPSIDPEEVLQPDVQVLLEPGCECFKCELMGSDSKLTLAVLKDRCLEKMGTVQNQTLTSYAYLNFDFFSKQDELPFKKGRIYKVQYKVDDRRMCFWCVTSIEDVTGTMKTSELPQVFCDWEQGRKNANVAPFDLAESERKKWQEDEAKREEKKANYLYSGGFHCKG